MNSSSHFFTDTYCPCLAIALGDPSGVGPELVARLLSDEGIRSQTNFVLFADRAEAERGMDAAGKRYPYAVITDLNALHFERGLPLLYAVGDGAGLSWAAPTAENGRHALAALEAALRFAQRGTHAGGADAVLYGPVSMQAMRLAGMAHSDELQWLASLLNHAGPVRKLNVVDGLWLTCVSSHVPAVVPDTIDARCIVEAVGLVSNGLRDVGRDRPRVALCAVSPQHVNGDDRGEAVLDIIKPAIEQARALGMLVDGPFSADTLFQKAFSGRREYDGVVAMCPGQTQLTAGLMGGARGVTVLGGLCVPVVSPAHSAACTVSQDGAADAGAMLQAFAMTVRLAVRRHANRSREAATGGLCSTA